jgi:hypothetical protein
MWVRRLVAEWALMTVFGVMKIAEKERLERVAMAWEDRRSEMLLISEGFLYLMDTDTLPHKAEHFDHFPDFGLEESDMDALYFEGGTGLNNGDVEVRKAWRAGSLW